MFSLQLYDDTTLKQDPHPEPGSEPQPLKDPHHAEGPSPPSRLDTCAVGEKSGHAPHGRLPIVQEGELSHPNEAPFQISPEAALRYHFIKHDATASRCDSD